MIGYLVDLLVRGGLSVDQARGSAVLFVSIPLAGVFRILPNKPNIKNLFSFCVGLWSFLFLFGWAETLVSLLTALAVYTPLRFSPKMYKCTALFSILMLLGIHLRRMIIDYMGWTMDFSAPMMMMTIKLMSFSFNSHDGIREKETLTEFELKHRIEPNVFPSVLEYLGHMYFFPGLLCAPTHEFMDYRNFITLEKFKEVGGKIPNNFKLICKLFLTVMVYFLGIAFIPYNADTFRETVAHNIPVSSIWKKAYYFYITLFAHRCKFYFAWTLAEIACDVSGIGFSGLKDGKPTWNNSKNFVFSMIEYHPSFSYGLTFWNITTSKWLRYYSYDRFLGTYFEPYRSVLSFMLCALWHGLYPGYYMVFFSMSIHRYACVLWRRRMRLRMLKLMTQRAYDVLTAICAAVGTASICPFLLLDATDTLNSWKNCWILYAPSVVLSIVLNFVPQPPKPVASEGSKQIEKAKSS
eukprot:TRINITY_DN7089_c0_g1_i2.p1 TRINITY_DN7089_c0_g1~~TRINITY_DN7089_c0_g1_i2.p1  ORF type:complete len:465 (+),score=89.17 TRINITY_DN7089_c0_g1_i2:55-1449(+)